MNHMINDSYPTKCQSFLMICTYKFIYVLFNPPIQLGSFLRLIIFDHNQDPAKPFISLHDRSFQGAYSGRSW